MAERMPVTIASTAFGKQVRTRTEQRSVARISAVSESRLLLPRDQCADGRRGVGRIDLPGHDRLHATTICAPTAIRSTVSWGEARDPFAWITQRRVGPAIAGPGRMEIFPTGVP